MSKYYTLKPRKFSIEFRDWRQASAHGGQLAVAALLDQFGLKDRVRRESALDPRTHKGKGFAPLAYVTQLLYSFTSGGVVARTADRLAATLLGVGQRIGERVELKISVGQENFRKGLGRETSSETEEVCPGKARASPLQARNNPAGHESSGNCPPARINSHRAATAIFKTPLFPPTRSVGKDQGGDFHVFWR